MSLHVKKPNFATFQPASAAAGGDGSAASLCLKCYSNPITPNEEIQSNSTLLLEDPCCVSARVTVQGKPANQETSLDLQFMLKPSKREEATKGKLSFIT